METKGTYNWSIITGGDKAEITMDMKSSVWIEPKKISDTTGDIVVEVEFTPTDPPGEPVYAYMDLTVFDVEIVNADSCYSETPVVTEFFTGETKAYKAKVKPSDFDWDICEWMNIPSDWIIAETDEDYCYIYGILPDYGILNVRLQRDDSGDAAVDGINFGIFSTNIQINDKGENQEESTGIYIRKGQLVPIKIGPSMVEVGSPEFVEMEGPEEIYFKIEAVANSGKISLWEYDETTSAYIGKSLPYTYSCTPSPGNPFLSKTNLYLKGEQTSNTDKDIKLTLKGYKIDEDDSIAVDTAIITVFDIDLDWEGLSEEGEEETGIYIALNVDDDNSDTILDKNQSPVFGENDMKKLIIRRPSPSNLPGFITLTISSGSSKIKLWEDTSTETKKVTEITYKNYNISDELQSDTWLWTEGYAISTTKEVELKITYQPPSETGEEDKVKATVKIGSVLIDPGHGGSDPGSVGPTGLQEKEPNLDIGLKLKSCLQNADVMVNMTRSGDVFFSLDDRNDTTIYYRPALFLSIHNNAPDSRLFGTETYTTSINYYALEDSLAHKTQSEVQSVVLEYDRGVKRSNFQVLRHSLNGNTDGILCEVTFIAHASSEARLRQDSFKQAVAEAMKKAILKVLVEDTTYPKQPNP